MTYENIMAQVGKIWKNIQTTQTKETLAQLSAEDKQLLVLMQKILKAQQAGQTQAEVLALVGVVAKTKHDKQAASPTYDLDHFKVPQKKIKSDGTIELDDTEGTPYKEVYKRFYKFMQNDMAEYLKNPEIRNALIAVGHLTENQIDEFLVKTGKGSLKIRIADLASAPDNSDNVHQNGQMGLKGMKEGGTEYIIEINTKLVLALENAVEEEIPARLLAVVSTVIHETTHYGHKLGSPEKIPWNQDVNPPPFIIGNWKRVYHKEKSIPKQDYKFDYYFNDKFVGDSNEEGFAIEVGLWLYEHDRKVPEDLSEEVKNAENLSYVSYIKDVNYKQGSRSLKSQNDLIEKLKKEGKEHLIPYLNIFLHGKN